MVTPPQISQFIVRSNPEAIYVIRNDGRIVDANEACSKMLGYSRDELLRLTVHDVSPRFTKRDWPNGWRMLKRRKSGILEGEHRAKDGHLIPVEITAIHLVSNGNEYVCAFAREITRRKKAEKSARESRQLIETIYDTIPEAVITTDLNYTVVSCNKSVLNVLGYSPDELVGKNYSTFVQKGMFEGPDREKRKTELFESGHLDQEEFLFQKKNGETFTGSFSVAMISDSEGKPAGLVGTIRDITRKKRADREIRGHAKRSAAIREASEALVASLDFATVVNKCATIAKDLIHADGVAIFLKNSEGTHLEPVISKGSYGTEVLSVKLKIGEGVSGSVAVSGKGQIVNRIDLTDLGKQIPGTPVEPESLLSAPLKRRGEVIGVITADLLGEREFPEEDLDFLEDLANICAAAIENARVYGSAQKEIDERKKAEEELRWSRDQLRRLSAHLQTIREEERTEIARDLHDELGHALTALKIDLSLLTKGASTEDTSMLKKTESMSQLIESSIRTVQRMAKELRPAMLDEIGLPAAIEWQAGEFQDRSGVRCRVNLDPELGSLDRDFSVAIFRIVQEALTNVARHAKATEVEVVLRKENSHLKLQVKDNGRGITRRDIFNPESFGLLGMRERIHPWGGEVDVEGEKGKGTTVTVNFPAAALQRE